jgi:hypothetical protein
MEHGSPLPGAVQIFSKTVSGSRKLKLLFGGEEKQAGILVEIVGGLPATRGL